MAKNIFALAACAATVACASATGRTLSELDLAVDESRVTVGGLSAGGFMAVQMHVAYSATFKGAGVWAGGPYYCAEGQEATALTTCMNPIMSAPNAGALAALTELAASKGTIDGPGNLTNARVYVYSGTDDTVVHRPVVQSLVDYYRVFVKNATSSPPGTGTVHPQFTTPSAHCFPTLNYGETCSQQGDPYIGKCNYDSAGDSLQLMYGTMKPRGTMNASNIFSFPQGNFTSNPSSISLESTGYVYVPEACQNGGTCGVHMNFHGCQQTLEDIQMDYVQHVGLNEWAETNKLIIVYPQVKKSYFMPTNPEGCWDWWGYSGSNYAVQAGPQMAFSKAVYDHLLSL